MTIFSIVNDNALMNFILDHKIRVRNEEWSIRFLAQEADGISGSSHSFQDLARMEGVWMNQNGDWFFDEEIIQNRPWWKNSPFNGEEIAESLKRIIAAHYYEN